VSRPFLRTVVNPYESITMKTHLRSSAVWEHRSSRRAFLGHGVKLAAALGAAPAWLGPEAWAAPGVAAEKKSDAKRLLEAQATSGEALVPRAGEETLESGIVGRDGADECNVVLQRRAFAKIGRGHFDASHLGTGLGGKRHHRA